MFYDRLKSICTAKGTSPTAVCKAIGLSNAIATRWKNGSNPRADTLQAIADYLQIPVASLLDGDQPAAPAQNPIVELIREEARDLTPEQLRQVIDFIGYLRAKK